MTVIKLELPKLIDDGTAPTFTRLESINDLGWCFELVFVNDQVDPPTRGAFRMARKTFEKLRYEVERRALGKATDVVQLH